MPTLISVDYDFLIPHGMFEESITLRQNGHKEDMPGCLVYDWQMREGNPPMLDQVVWETRARNFKRWGLDIAKLTEPKLGPGDFITDLSCKVGGASVPTWHADSHTWGAVLTRDLSGFYGPLDVVNFDAHHDLGYNQELDVKDDNIDCGNWALAGLTRGWIKNYTLVYPDWLGEAEIAPSRREAIEKQFGSTVKITTWSEFVANHPEIDTLEGALFVRSSAWTPPWLDAGFQELLLEWGWSDCLDCQHGQMCSPYDACVQREWDWEEFASMCEQRDVLEQALLERARAEAK